MAIDEKVTWLRPVVPVDGKAEAPDPVERACDVSRISDKQLVILFTDATLEMKLRADRLRGLRMVDDRGRTWSMNALLKRLAHVVEYLGVKFKE